MGRSPAPPRRDTRREILDAALDLFAEHGFHGTSMRALAAAVGVRESALYHHFPSKELLLDAVIQDRAEVRSAALERALAELGDKSLAEVLALLAEELVGHLQSPRERKFLRMAMALGVQLGGDDSPFRRLAERPRQIFGKLFGALQQSGRLRRDLDLEVFVAHFVAPLVFASGVLWAPGRGPIRVPLADFVRAHVAFMVRAAGQ